MWEHEHLAAYQGEVGRGIAFQRSLEIDDSRGRPLLKQPGLRKIRDIRDPAGGG